ncbi:MAG: hypothetical protein FD189_751 [Elusimicrobia bacterium]|nr:MAG: hypothetical protein FD154_682 [Elusimicrobiota bacterium]KAF0156997.1 MAG: hypothetical protein FD189_751 [Elusimicrobiota bacterium]
MPGYILREAEDSGFFSGVMTQAGRTRRVMGQSQNGFGKPPRISWRRQKSFLSVKARRLGFGILEPDILHRKRAGGRSHVRLCTPFVFLAQLLRLRFSDFGAGK